MLDMFLVRKDSLENVYENEKAVGFKFAVRIADYKGCILSLHNGYYLEVDEVEYPKEICFLHTQIFYNTFIFHAIFRFATYNIIDLGRLDEVIYSYMKLC